MTKIQVQFNLQHKLDDSMFARISDAHSLYGIFRVQVAPSARPPDRGVRCHAAASGRSGIGTCGRGDTGTAVEVP